MLKGFIKPDLQSKDPVQRREALDRLDEDNPANQSSIEKMAGSDPDPDVRVSAISKLRSAKVLDQLMQAADKGQAPSTTAYSEAATGRLKQLLQDSTIDDSLLGSVDSSSNRFRVIVACECNDPAVRGQALETLSSEESFAEVVTGSRFHDAREVAEQHIRDPELLEQCVSKVKNRDKVVARKMQARLTEFRAEAEQRKLHAASIEHLLSSVRKHADAVWSPQYPAQLTALESKWSALDPAPDLSLQEQFSAHASTAKSRVIAREKSQQQAQKGHDALQQLTELSSTLGSQPLDELLKSASKHKVRLKEIDTLWTSFTAAGIDASEDEQVGPLVSGFKQLKKEVSIQLDCVGQLLKTTLATREPDTGPGADAVQTPSKAEVTITDQTATQVTTQVTTQATTQEATQATTQETAETVTQASSEASGQTPGQSPVQSPLQSTGQSQNQPDPGLAIETSVQKPVPEPGSGSDAPAKTKSVKPEKVIDHRRTVTTINRVLEQPLFSEKLHAASELREKLKKLEGSIAAEVGEKQEALKQFHRQMNSLGAVIKKGNWTTANSMYQRLEKKLQRLDASQAKSVNGKFTQLQSKLNELADWKDFADKPKLDELCAQMEALPAESVKPPELARRIKELQVQWKNIGSSRASNELWPRFKLAGDKAYEPCSAYFDEQTKQREARTRNKEAVCQRLQELLDTTDWENADGRAIERSVSQSKREWSNNKIHRRKPNKELEDRFSKLIAAFDEKLKVQYEAGIAERQDLIEKVRKLSEADVNQHAINQLRKIQSAWKQCGIAPRKDDQVLWEEFNGLCGEIYGKRRQDQKEQYKASMEHVDRARDIIKSISRLAGKSKEPSEKDFSQLQEEFQSLPEFPEKLRRGLFRDYERASDSYSKARSTSAKMAVKQEVEELRRLAELCEKLELLSQSGSQSPVGDALKPGDTAGDAALAVDTKEDIEDLWVQTEITLPKPWLRKIEKRRTNALKAMEGKHEFTFEENEKQRRLHCIKLEILRDRETPAEDKAARMAYQLEQLQSGPDSSRLIESAEQLLQLEVEWLCSAPAGKSVAANLNKRFYQALK